MIKISAPDDVSRIDKFWLDRDGTTPEESRTARASRRLQVLVGADVADSHAKQVALLTLVNLAAKCFAAPVHVIASDSVWAAPTLVRVSLQSTLGKALEELGAQRSIADIDPDSCHILLGDAEPLKRSLRLTFDGWKVSVGPAAQVPRLAERPWCVLAPLAAAAVAVGEVFASFARISVTATHRPIGFSLWRPDLPFNSPDSLGIGIEEAPLELSCFGLGHLGQAYLWALACLPFSNTKSSKIYLCDDDLVERPNLETGALLTAGVVGLSKTRVVAEWLEERGFGTRLVERFVDSNYCRSDREPVIALSGFDDNQARQWLAQADFPLIFDSGLGGESTTFDSIALHTWPNPRPAGDLWPLEDAEERRKREERTQRRADANHGYRSLVRDECGRVLVAGKSVAVPFVGAVSSAFVLAEVLRALNAGPAFYDTRLRVCTLSDRPVTASLRTARAGPVSGVRTGQLTCA
jgi:hypothetical protein